MRRSQDHLGAEPAPALPLASRRPGGSPGTGRRARRSSGISPAGWTPTRRSSGSTGPACWSWRCGRCRGSGRSSASSNPPAIDERPRWRADRRASRGSSTCCSASIGNCTRRAEPVDVLQPQHPPARRSPRALRRRTDAAELRRAPAWAQLGRRVLIEQMARQISPDGGHVERSFHYHRYTLDFYLLALAVARLTGDDARGPSPKRHGGWPLRADHRRRPRTPGPDRRRRRRAAAADLRTRQRRRQRLAGRGRVAARRSLARRRPGAEEAAWMSAAPPRSATPSARYRTTIPSTTLGDSGYTVAARRAAITWCSTPGRTGT